MKLAFKNNLERDTLNNKHYRKVINTTKTQQLVLMNLQPRQEIGVEKHAHTTQFIRVEAGNATAIVNDKRFNLRAGDSITIPPGAVHNIIASKNGPVQLYTIYSPPEHAPNLVQPQKLDM